MVDVVVEDLEGDALERGRDGADLRKNVDAVTLVLDHFLDPANLSLDPVQALDEPRLVGVVAVNVLLLLSLRHARTIPLRGISALRLFGQCRPPTA